MHSQNSLNESERERKGERTRGWESELAGLRATVWVPSFMAAGKKRLKAKLVNRESQQQESKSRRWKKSEEKENGGPESAGFSAQVAGKAKSKYSAIFNCTHTHTHTETRTHTHTYA